MIWFLSVLREYYPALSKDFTKLGYNIDLIGKEGLRSMSIQEAYFIIRDEFVIPGHWFHAEIDSLKIPVSIFDETRYIVDNLTWNRYTQNKNGRSKSMPTNLFRDKVKYRKKKRDEQLSLLSDEEKQQLQAYNNGEDIFKDIKYEEKKSSKFRR